MLLRRVFALGLVLWSQAGFGDPVAANFSLRTKSGDDQRVAEFVLVRTEDAVEVQNRSTGIVERWEHDPSGRVFYSRIFLEVGKIIDYQPADFASADIADDWQQVRSVVDMGTLEKLKRDGQGRAFGAGTERYRGTVDGTAVMIDWIADLALPARVQRRSAGQRSELRMTSLVRGDAATAIRVSDDRLAAFERIDFADLGDREGDPVIERLVAQSGMILHSH